MWRLVRVTAVILAVIGVTVLVADLIEDWPYRESYDWPFWIGFGLIAGDGDSGGDFGGDGGGGGGDGGGGG